MEKRRHKRYTKRLETKIVSGDTEMSSITSDLSVGGLFIRTQRGLTPGSEVIIELYLPDKKVCKVRGRVQRTVKTSLPTKKNGMGIELVDITNDSCYVEFLEAFIADTSEENPEEKI